MRFAAALAASLLLSAGCSRGRDTVSAPVPAASADPVPPKEIALGEPVSAPLVALADIAREPGRYDGKAVATSGKVTAVCRERGCWLEMADASGRAHVRIHGHSFSVPRTAPGHVARVQARVLMAHGGADDCEEQASGGDAGLARVELDATGVELD